MTEPGKAVPSVPIAPGNFDRAWNDPPQFSYNESAAATQKPTNRLNRRVAYPTAAVPPPQASQANQGTSHLPDAGAKSLPGSGMPLPPPPKLGAGILPPPPSTLSSSAPQVPAVRTEMSSLSKDEICSKLKTLMTKYCGDKATDLLKRLQLMEKSLDSGLPTENRIVQILSEFIQLIERKELSGAEARLTSLGADYPGECAQWIICLRHLAADIKTKEQSDETDSMPAAPASFPFFVPAPQQ